MATGTVTWLDHGKDCGFIASAEGGTDLFFHSADVDGKFSMLIVGSNVIFERGEAARGLIVARAVALRTSEAGTEHVAVPVGVDDRGGHELDAVRARVAYRHGAEAARRSEPVSAALGMWEDDGGATRSLD